MGAEKVLDRDEVNTHYSCPVMSPLPMLGEPHWHFACIVVGPMRLCPQRAGMIELKDGERQCFETAVSRGPQTTTLLCVGTWVGRDGGGAGCPGWPTSTRVIRDEGGVGWTFDCLRSGGPQTATSCVLDDLRLPGLSETKEVSGGHSTVA